MEQENDNNQKLEEQRLTIAPNPRVIIETQMQMRKREEKLSDEDKYQRYAESLISNEEDDDYKISDNDFEWVDISVDISKVSAVSRGD